MAKSSSRTIKVQAWPETPRKAVKADGPSTELKALLKEPDKEPRLELVEKELEERVARWIAAERADFARAEKTIKNRQQSIFRRQTTPLVKIQGEEAQRALDTIRELRQKGCLKRKKDREMVFLAMKLAFHIDRALPEIYPNAERGSKSLNVGSKKGGTTQGENKRKVTDSDIALIRAEGVKRRSKHSQRRTAELLAALEPLQHLSPETIRKKLQEMGI